jgi:hypothetical protein
MKPADPRGTKGAHEPVRVITRPLRRVPVHSPFAPRAGLVSSVSPPAGSADGPRLRPMCIGPWEVDVPLSEHEQRLLEQIERALVDDDPKFASSVRTGDRRLKARRRIQLGGLLVVVGLAVMVLGPVTHNVLIGVLGFLLMLGGAALGVLNYKAATGAVEAGAAPPAGKGGPTRGRPRRAPLKNRLEERFRRRYDQ